MSDNPPQEEDVNLWQYYAEGGGHLLMERCNKGTSDSQGFEILRIPKFHLSYGESRSEQLQYGSRNQLFVNESFKAWFPNNIVTSSLMVALSEGFIERVISIVQDHRPEGRRKKTLKLASFGYRERNLFTIQKLCLNEARPVQTLSFELKVKSSLLSISPFLDASTYPKLFYDRYYLTQYYKDYKAHRKRADQGIDQLPWGKFERRSLYHPSDICSGDSTRIISAIGKLLDNPQNNLGVFHNGIRCYGWDMSDPSLLQDAVTNFFHPVAASTLQTSMLMRSLFTLVIKEETVLQDVELMQYLDWIDAEGVALCYSQFLRFYTTEKEFQQYLLNELSKPLDRDIITIALYIKEIHNKILSETQLSTVLDRGKKLFQHSPKLFHLLEITIKTRQMMSNFTYEDVNDEKFDHWRSEVRKECEVLIEEATLDEIIFLLKLWMLAAISKDCSLIITLIHVNTFPCQELLRKCNHDSPDTIVDLFVVNRQTIEGNGQILIKDTNEIILEYQISLIDIGLKDFAKFLTRKDKDIELCEIYKNKS